MSEREMRHRVPIDSIVIGDRKRKELGDLAALARSIEKVGVLSPPVVTPGMGLIFGFRRLEALRMLGRSEVDVIVAPDLVTAAARAEHDENVCRKAMTPSETKAAYDAMMASEKPAAKVRQVEGARRGGSLPPSGGNLPRPRSHRNEASDIAAKAVGTSATTVRRIEKVLAAAAAPDADEETRALAEAMESGRLSPTTAHRMLEGNAPTKAKRSAPPSPNVSRLRKIRADETVLAVINGLDGLLFVSRDLKLSSLSAAQGAEWAEKIERRLTALRRFAHRLRKETNANAS